MADNGAFPQNSASAHPAVGTVSPASLVPLVKHGTPPAIHAPALPPHTGMVSTAEHAPAQPDIGTTKSTIVFAGLEIGTDPPVLSVLLIAIGMEKSVSPVMEVDCGIHLI